MTLFKAVDILHNKIDEVADEVINIESQDDFDNEVIIAAYALVRLRHAAEYLEREIIEGI